MSQKFFKFTSESLSASYIPFPRFLMEDSLAEIMRSQLAHFVLDEIQFLLVQADFLADGSRAIWHEAHSFRCSPNAPFSSRISR